MKPQSLNRYIVETYKEDRALKATVQNGFAMVSQKICLKGLKLLANAVVAVGDTHFEYPIGSTVYIKESSLQSQPWAKVSFSSESIEGNFMIVDPIHVEFVVSNEDESNTTTYDWDMGLKAND